MNEVKKNRLKLKKWDSQFFGYKVAQLHLTGNEAIKFDDLINEIGEERIRLTYIFVSPEETELNSKILKAGAHLADIRTVYSKCSEPHTIFSNKMREFAGICENDDLIRLGLEAGKYSRFRMDGNFQNNEFERLYRQMVINSFNKASAIKNIVAMHGDDIIGLITVVREHNQANVGLLAVKECFRGKGIGMDLVAFADNLAFELKLDKIKIVTQLHNSCACKLYEKCNFKIEEILNIYHYWH
ncbi:GNAT family N-acetyltransferase [Saccharicrinis sp. GN24d3]|uniref:GNAT family N-acetyltransferase n=1 Tax=Saccharicrinis sp. GN24d3 TaxID=3458416 RepID=UPI0040362C6C